MNLVETSAGGTELHYVVKSEVGKLASIGTRLLEGTARKIVGQFFDTFITQVEVAMGR